VQTTCQGLSHDSETTQNPVVKVEMQRWGNCNFRFWPSVGGCGPSLTVLDHFAPVDGRAPRLLNQLIKHSRSHLDVNFES